MSMNKTKKIRKMGTRKNENLAKWVRENTKNPQNGYQKSIFDQKKDLAKWVRKKENYVEKTRKMGTRNEKKRIKSVDKH